MLAIFTVIFPRDYLFFPGLIKPTTIEITTSFQAKLLSTFQRIVAVVYKVSTTCRAGRDPRDFDGLFPLKFSNLRLKRINLTR